MIFSYLRHKDAELGGKGGVGGVKSSGGGGCKVRCITEPAGMEVPTVNLAGFFFF